jgi:hypothetical protein
MVAVDELLSVYSDPDSARLTVLWFARWRAESSDDFAAVPGLGRGFSLVSPFVILGGRAFPNSLTRDFSFSGFFSTIGCGGAEVDVGGCDIGVGETAAEAWLAAPTRGKATFAAAVAADVWFPGRPLW